VHRAIHGRHAAYAQHGVYAVFVAQRGPDAALGAALGSGSIDGCDMAEMEGYYGTAPSRRRGWRARAPRATGPSMAANSDPVDALLTTILAGDRGAAIAAARRAFDAGGVEYLYESVIEPALSRVGQLWYEDRITVADEHLATAVAEAAIAALYPSFPWPARGGAKAVVACAQEEHHTIGARMVADLLALDGWDDVFLGGDVPVESLVAKVVALDADVVALSVTLTHHLPFLNEAVERLRARAASAKIVVGGRAMTEHAAPLGVDAVAHRAAEVVEVARGWRR
jgi:methanogenic corrinoid protein MtbC1